MKKLLLLLWVLPQAQLLLGQTPTFLTQQERIRQVELAQQQQQKEGLRVATAAPYVFLGRPLTGETYQDKTGRYYESTVYQVLEVLRGKAAIRPGTITLNRSSFFQMQPLTPPEPGYEQVLQPQRGNSEQWGIFFCNISPLPANPNPYRTSNRVVLTPYTLTSQLNPVMVFAMSVEGCHQGTSIVGLGHSFSSEQEMNAFLQRVPNLKDLVQQVQEYPWIAFVDERPNWQAYRKAHPPEEGK